MNVPVTAKIGRRVESPVVKARLESDASATISSQNTAKVEHSGTSISIHNHIGNREVGGARSLPTLPSRESAEPVVLATPEGPAIPIMTDEPIDSLTMWVDGSQLPEPLKTSKFEPDVETINENVELVRFRGKASEELNIVVDVAFLKHVIKTIMTNHAIISTTKDLEDVLSYFGEVELRCEKQTVLTRAPKKSGMCGCSADEIEQTVDIISKVLVNSVNVVKRVPAFVEFLMGLGLSI